MCANSSLCRVLTSTLTLTSPKPTPNPTVTVTLAVTLTAPPNAHPHPNPHQASLQLIAASLLNGSFGLSMPLKTALIGALLFDAVVVMGICGGDALKVAVCQVGVVLVGATVAHLAELYLRRVYVEKARLNEGRWRLAERNEQLKAEKERLQYDVLRVGGGHALNDDARSAIRRGLQAGQPRAWGGKQASDLTNDVHRSVSEAGFSGGPAPSDGPPPSLPPGAPSSAASGSFTDSANRSNSSWPIPDWVPPLTWANADRQFYAEQARKAAAEQAREAARLAATLEAARLATKPAKRRRPSDDGRAAAAHGQPSQTGATPPISWSEIDRGDLRQFPVYVEMPAKRSGSFEEAAALGSIAASLCGHAPPPLTTEQPAAPLSSSEADRKPHTDRAGVGCSGPAPGALKRALAAPGALRPAQPAVAEMLFPTAELVLAEVLATEEAEMAAMAEMVEMVDDEVVDSLTDHMAEMVDDERRYTQHSVHNYS